MSAADVGLSASRWAFWKDVGVVLSGAAVAQAIPLIGSLVIARLFLPADFGTFAAWLGATTLAAVAVSGRYELALVLEPTSAGRRVGAHVTLWVAVVASAGIAICCVLALMAPGPVSQSSWAPLMLLVAPTGLLMASTQTWQSWAAAESRFMDLSAMRIAQSTGITGLQVFAGLVSSSALSLALGHALGVTVALAFATRRLPVGHIDRADARAFLRRHVNFPLWSLPGGFINAGAAQLPVFVVAVRFGADIAGYLALVLRILGAPTALLGASVLDVFKVRAAASYRERGQCREDYLRTLRGLAIGSAIVCIPVALFSEELFAFLFGERWHEAGVMAAWLLPLFALRFVASPLSYMFFIAGRQRLDLAWQVALLAMTVTTLTVGVQYSTTLQLYSAGYSLLYLLYLWMSFRLSCGRSKAS
jgi:O-antigen/teichoic acid export membrane protein